MGLIEQHLLYLLDQRATVRCKPHGGQHDATCRFAGHAEKLLDLACGRGGDIFKWAKAEVQTSTITSSCSLLRGIAPPPCAGILSSPAALPTELQLVQCRSDMLRALTYRLEKSGRLRGALRNSAANARSEQVCGVVLYTKPSLERAIRVVSSLPHKLELQLAWPTLWLSAKGTSQRPTDKQ